MAARDRQDGLAHGYCSTRTRVLVNTPIQRIRPPTLVNRSRLAVMELYHRMLFDWKDPGLPGEILRSLRERLG